jgi:hypothetical protein
VNRFAREGIRLILLFGHGVPISHPVLAGLPVRDITRVASAPRAGSAIAPLLEPFLDAFARAFLFALEEGVAAEATAIIVWQGGAGALLAHRYAAEFRRHGLLPRDPPLHLWRCAAGGGPAARRFAAAEAERIRQALAGLPREEAKDWTSPLAALEAAQAAGRIAGAEACERRLRARAAGLPVEARLPADTAGWSGPRLALAGAPLGNSLLHRWIEAKGGRIVLDLTGPDPPEGDPVSLMASRGVERLFWQVDPHDDLHGWRWPELRAACAARGIATVDLGFLPSWPEPGDLAALAGRLPP